MVLRETASETLTQQAGKIIETEHGQQIISFSIVPIVNAGYTNFYGRNITERKHAEELWKYREHLEELVKERTTELAMANEQLQREITERKRAEIAVQEAREFAESNVRLCVNPWWS